MAQATGGSRVLGVLGNWRESPGAQKGPEVPPAQGASLAGRPEMTGSYFPPLWFQRLTDAGRGRHLAGAAAPAHVLVFFLRRSAPMPNGQDKSAAGSGVWAGSHRATLNK